MAKPPNTTNSVAVMHRGNSTAGVGGGYGSEDSNSGITKNAAVKRAQPTTRVIHQNFSIMLSPCECASSIDYNKKAFLSIYSKDPAKMRGLQIHER